MKNLLFILALFLFPLFTKAQCLKGDCYNGKGLYQYDNGTHQGSFKNGKIEGYGIRKYDDGDRYEGFFTNGYFDKKGTYFYSSGAKYEGEYKKGKMHGKGVYIHPDGERYVGDFINGQFEGNGNYYFRNGSVYTGGWKKSKIHGKGTWLNQDGSKYIGNFADGDKKGFGIYYYDDGDVFEGQWKNDNIVKGKYTFYDGQIYNINWKNGSGDDSIYDQLWDMKHRGKCNVASVDYPMNNFVDYRAKNDSMYLIYKNAVNSKVDVLTSEAYTNYFDDEDYIKAIDAFTKLYNKDTTDISILLFRGMAYYSNDQSKKAIPDFIKLNKRFPDDEFLMDWLAYNYKRSEQDSLAAIWYEKVLAVNNKNIEVHQFLATLYTNLEGQQKKAIREYEYLIKEQPLDIYLKYDFVDFYLKNKDSVNAEILLKEIVANCPDDLFAMKKIAGLYKDNEFHATAINYYTRILNTENLSKKFPPDEIESVYFSRAWANHNSGHPKEAIRDYNTAISMDANSALYWNNLAYVYVTLHQPDTALLLLQKSLAVDSLYSYAWSTMAEAYAVKGDSKKFYQYFEKALKMGEKDFGFSVEEKYIEEDKYKIYAPYKEDEKFKKIVKKYSRKEEE